MFKSVCIGTIEIIKKWKLYIGKDPRFVPRNSIIIFPLDSNVMCCGLAGILTIKGCSEQLNSDAVELIGKSYKKIKQLGMSALLSGKASSDKYLDGEISLRDMERSVLFFKTDKQFEQIFFNPDKAVKLSKLTSEIKSFFTEEEKNLEQNAGQFSTVDLEIVNSRLIILKDIIWALEKDVLSNIEKIILLAGVDGVADISQEALTKYRKLNFLLNCVDRLEVRGRDSAGVQISLTFSDNHALDASLNVIKGLGLYEDFLNRVQYGDLADRSIYISQKKMLPKGRQTEEIVLSFTYKTFSIIGELGRNVRALRESIATDRILNELAGQGALFETAFAHTRWASVGFITEENCHPVNNYTFSKTDKNIAGHQEIKSCPFYGERTWMINVVLNGDIDNYQSLREKLEEGRELIAPEVTTDTKIIPLQIERYLSEGYDLTESFRLAVSDFEGSHAIAMMSDLEPGKAFLALKGSGQSIYVGISPDQYIFSSELYGLVDRTPEFIKMNGEKQSSSGESGQIFILDQNSQGGTSGIKAFFYDGTPLNVDERDLQRAEITTRDIDRGNHPHFFMKEITEATLSVKKTLRGKYRISQRDDGIKGVVFNIGEDILPKMIRDDFHTNKIRRIIVIGHGTAAVAGSAVADALEWYLQGTHIKIEAKIASELSGFSLQDDLRDTLIIPITQSGTTTDTNRAVAMAAHRNASIIAIVNRRQSDITSKSHGVFYTSDGRDIEMSVASTKAFYSQIIAGHVLALCFSQIMATKSDDFIAEQLQSLEQIPDMMTRVMNQKDKIKDSAERMVKEKKYWAIVGSGPNKVSSDEIRIKLSELCYKTISSDVIENKKHIDLSAEPLIIVCAAGNPKNVVEDIIKDVAIFKAHKAGIVVFADEGEKGFDGTADTVIEIPNAPLPVPVILNTLAGHLWGYYAACSINEDAIYLREFLNRLNFAMVEQGKKNYSLYDRIMDRDFLRMVREFSEQFNERRRHGSFFSTSTKTISDLVLLLKYVAGKLPLEDFWIDFKADGGLISPIDVLTMTLSNAVDELSRPVDAIRHQAKTVTVGTSRKEQSPAGVIFDLLRDLEFTPKTLISKNVPTINRIQSSINTINGYTLYGINNLDIDSNPTDSSTISIVKKGGISLAMKSRAENSNVLMGTKKITASTRRVHVGLGKSDNASIIIIPLLGLDKGVRNLLLIHVSFNETLSAREKKNVLGNKFKDIRNIINEYNLDWIDSYLNKIPISVLFSEPPEVIADQIKQDIKIGQKKENICQTG